MKKLILITILAMLTAKAEGQFELVELSSEDLSQSTYELEPYKEKYSFYDIKKLDGVNLKFFIALTDGRVFSKNELYETTKNAKTNGNYYLQIVQVVRNNQLVIVPAKTTIEHLKEVDSYFINWYWKHYSVYEKTTIEKTPQRCFQPYLETIVQNLEMQTLELAYKEVACKN